MAKKKAKEKPFSGRMDQVGKYYVETWYDKTSRSWVTEIKEEADGLDVRGGSDLSGHRDDARHYHEQALLEASRMQ